MSCFQSLCSYVTMLTPDGYRLAPDEGETFKWYEQGE